CSLLLPYTTLFRSSGRLVPQAQVVLLARRHHGRAVGGLGDQRLAVAVRAAGQLDPHRLVAAAGVGGGGEREVVVTPAGLLPAVRHVAGAGGLEAGVLDQVGGGGGLRRGEEQARGEGADGQQ